MENTFITQSAVQPETRVNFYGQLDKPEEDTFLDCLPIPAVQFGLKSGQISCMNHAFEQVLGYELWHFSTVSDLVLQTHVNSEQVQATLSLLDSVIGQGGSVFALPQLEADILSRSGEIRTCLVNIRVVQKEDRVLLTFTDITDRKIQEEKVQQLALEDDLTQLANRRAFNRNLESQISYASRYESRFALLLLDVDNFKGLNDTYGHDCGDLALQHIARGIQDSIRNEDLACRLGGDEFAVLINMPGKQSGVEEVAARIRSQVAEALTLAQRQITLSVSIGSAIYGLDGIEADTLYKSADKALYRAKSVKTGWQVI